MRAQLTGRDAELGQMLLVLDAVERGSGQTVLVTGVPGVGKTRLADEAVAEADRRHFTVLRGRAHPLRIGLALSPLTQALLPYLAALPAEARKQLTESLPELRWLLAEWQDGTPTGGARMEAVGDPSADATSVAAFERTRLFDAIGILLTRLARARPVAFFVDDLHWADPGTVELFHHLSGQLESAAVLLLASARDAPPTADPGQAALRHLQSALRRQAGSHVLPLTALTDGQIRQLARQASDVPLDASHLDRLVNRAAGIPLFAVALLEDMLLQRPAPEGRQEGTVDTLFPGTPPPGLPDVVSDVVRERLEALTAAQREAVTLLAVAGRASGQHLAAALRLPLAQLQEALYELEAAGLSRHVSDGPEEF